MSEIEFGADVEEDLEEVTPVITTDADIEEAYENASLRVVYQSNNFFLPQLYDLIEGRDIINLRPEYQRRLRWSKSQKSLLIESFLLNIPIPPIFLYESESARYEVMDGQQRLNAVHDFLSNGFPLGSLNELSFLNGKRYRDLPPAVRRGLERASLSATVLLKETRQSDNDPLLVRRYVFERLNTGGKPLNAQEMRNSIYQGYMNDLIIELARHDDFCEVFGIPLYTGNQDEYYEDPARQRNTLYKTMKDCEIVLRALALVEEEHIRGSMKKILNEYMHRHRDDTEDTIVNIHDEFTRSLSFWLDVMGDDAFLLPPNDRGNRRVSIALFDSSMAAAIRVLRARGLEHIDRVSLKEQVDGVVYDDDNFDLIVGRANTAAAIQDRISLIQNLIN